MGNVVLAGLALAALLLSPAAAQEPVDLELVLAADGSPSIDEDEFRLQREGYAEAITHPRVLAAIRSGPRQGIALALIEWGAPDSQHVIVDWMAIRDEASARAFADELLARPRMARGYNSISAAIDYAARMIGANAFAGAHKVIDVSGDGPNIGGRPVQAARADAVAQGIVVNALVVKTPGGALRGPGGIPLEEHYERDVIGGSGSFVMIADSRKSFAQALIQKMIREIADAARNSKRLAQSAPR